MSEETPFELATPQDPTIDPYAMEDVPEVKGTGIVTQCKLGGVSEKNGSIPVSITVEYPEDSPNRDFITASLYFHPQRMLTGANNSDLDAGKQKNIAISKRQLTEFAKAADKTLGQLISAPDEMVGTRVAFSAGPQNLDGSRYQWKSLYKPKQ